MVKKIKRYLKSGKISKLNEIEKLTYLNFLSVTYKENLNHSKYCLKKFSRWAIISGYYAMHDISKLFLADKFDLKINFNVHKITIEVFEELIEDKSIINLLNKGYDELREMMNDLVDAKEKRINAQYYTGTKFMKDKYRKEAKDFLFKIVYPFIEKIRGLSNDKFD